MSVDLISNLTPQEIFNKSKKPSIVTEELLSQFSKPKSSRKLVPVSTRGSLKKLQFAEPVFSLVFTSFLTTPSRFQFQVCLFPSHEGHSLVLIHLSEEKRKVAAVPQRVPSSTSAGRHGVTRSSRS